MKILTELAYRKYGKSYKQLINESSIDEELLSKQVGGEIDHNEAVIDSHLGQAAELLKQRGYTSEEIASMMKLMQNTASNSNNLANSIQNHPIFAKTFSHVVQGNNSGNLDSLVTYWQSNEGKQDVQSLVDNVRKFTNPEENVKSMKTLGRVLLSKDKYTELDKNDFFERAHGAMSNIGDASAGYLTQNPSDLMKSGTSIALDGAKMGLYNIGQSIKNNPIPSALGVAGIATLGTLAARNKYRKSHIGY